MSNLNDFEVEFRCAKAGQKHAMPFGDLPEASQQAIIRYGAMRFINDKVGGLDAHESEEKFFEVLGQLCEGWQGRQGSTGSGVDRLEQKAMGLARDQVKAAILAKGIKLKQVGKEKIAELAKNLFDTAPDKFKTEAQKILDTEKAAKENAAEGVDLTSLGL